MQPPRVVFMGETIFPIVAKMSAGFSSMAVIVDDNREQRGSGTLGIFETRDDAFECAVEHAKADIRRHCLMTMVC
ncbi:hypothetical protein SAMN05414139_03451 [Burkholderia sp. D7]|nr:hypothetical protein SAMN05414139_03451 [Burkholderia sp. D7]